MVLVIYQKQEAIKKVSDDGDKDIFYGGINLTLSF